MPTVNASWNGATADWNTPGDWSDGIVPDTGNTDVTLAGSGAYTISIAEPESFSVGMMLLSDAKATLALDANSALTITGAFTQTGGTTTIDGKLAAAKIYIDGGGLTFNSSFTNTGTLAAADGGTIDFGTGNLSNLSGTTLTGGTYVVDAGSTLQLTDNQEIVTLAAKLTLSNAGSVVQSLDTSTGANVAIESTLTTIAAAGVLKVLGNRTYATTNALADSGSLTIGGTLTAASLSVAAGATLLVEAGATLSLGSPLKLAGTATNAGTIDGGEAIAIMMAKGADRLILDPGAAFGGKVAGGGSGSILELAKGSSSGILDALGTNFTKFGKVTVDAGATWTVDALAAALNGVTITGSGGSNTLVLESSGGVTLVGVSRFPTIDLAAGNSTVTVADKTLSGGSVTINAGDSGNNHITAAGDTAASKGKSLTYVAGLGIDNFAGGFENDVVKVSAAAVSGDTFTGGRGTNTLDLTTAGTFNLSGVGKFGTINLAAGNSTVTVIDETLSGGSVTIKDGASGSNRITASGDTAASKGKTLTYLAGGGADSFTGGFENDVVEVSAAAVGKDTLTGGAGTNTLGLTNAGTFSLSGIGKFGTIDLAAGNNSVTVADKTLGGGSVTIKDGASGNNRITASGDTAASKGKTLTYIVGAGSDMFTGGFENDVVNASGDTVASKGKTLIFTAGSGTDTLIGGFENDVVKVGAAAVGGDTLTGGRATNTLDLTTAGTVSLSKVSKFGTINLAAGNSTVTVADKTLSGGSVTIKDGADGNNRISAAGDTAASKGKTLTYLTGAGTDSFAGGFENDVVKVGAAAVGGDTLTGGRGTSTLDLTTAGTFSLSGVGKFGTINLAAGNSIVTVADNTLSGGSVTINDGASGNNRINAAGDTAASTGKTLIYLAGSGTDTFAGGFENDVVKVGAATLGRDILTGGSGSNTLGLMKAGTLSLSGVSKFGTINLAAGNSTVAVTDNTLVGGSVTIKDGASGNNRISAAGDTVASAGKTLTFTAGSGTDSFTGGFENDVVQVSAGAVNRDTLTGGLGSNKLTLTTAGTFSLAGVSKFGTINLAAGNNTVTVTDKTLSGGNVTIKDGASGNNSINAVGDTSASARRTLTFTAGLGTDSFTGGSENDMVKVGAAAVGGDTLTGGSGTNTLTLTTAGTVNLAGISNFGTIKLAAGDSTAEVDDNTLSVGSVTIKDGASKDGKGGDNSISAADDSVASAGKTLTYLAGLGADKFTGGFEDDLVKVSAAAVGGDMLTGGSGTNTLDLTTAGTFSLSGVSNFGTITLAAGNNTVTVTDNTLSGGSVTIKDGASGNNSITAAGDTKASTGKTLTFMPGSGKDTLTGGFENDVFYAGGNTTMTGGAGSNEFVFSAAGTNTITDFAPPAVTPTLTTLISFIGADGARPGGGLIADAAGDLFGTTSEGGANNDGTVFELVKNGSGSYTFTTLVSFNGTNGVAPRGLIADAAGNLFGTTEQGGDAHSNGTVFELVNNGGGSYTLATLASFDGADGRNPIAGLIADAAGDLFGTTSGGGTKNDGTVFELVNDGGSYTLTTLVSFQHTPGARPFGGLTIDAAGDLFGTTAFGGVYDAGTIFELVKNGSGGYTPTALATFTGPNGAEPKGSLISDAAGDLFGTTYAGGGSGFGTVFELVNNGSGGHTLISLANFNGTNGEYPDASLIADADGDLFGTTSEGGLNNDGTVFELVNEGGGSYTFTTRVNFTAADAGGLIADGVGDLFGTTAGGGTNGTGTVFKVTDAGFVVSPTKNEIVFSNKGFDLGLGGATSTPKALPAGLFVSDSTGTFTETTQRFAYGTTNGELFYSASGSTAAEHLVATLKGAPALTASNLFFIT